MPLIMQQVLYRSTVNGKHYAIKVGFSLSRDHVLWNVDYIFVTQGSNSCVINV